MRSWLVASTLTLLLSLTSTGQENQLEPPKEPEGRFTLFVYAVDDAEAGEGQSIFEVINEVKMKE